jgi:tRNA pseudouridine55 synthase
VHGWLIIDKPVGPTSTRIVGAVKRALREGGYPKVKVGHGGTLDPLASGVLPIALGEATKLSGRMLDADKAYEFTIRFGSETDTLDLEGAVIETSEKRPTRAAIEAILPRFTGEIEQVPPAYSALKVDGTRAYDLARAGEEVVLASRSVVIHTLRHSRESGNPGGGGEGKKKLDPRVRGDDEVEAVTLEATVSKGTYIRSLARDIARALDTVGHVAMLRRTKAGPFALQSAISLDKLGEAAKRTLIGIAAQPGLHLATDQDVPVALVELGEGELRVVRGFNL